MEVSRVSNFNGHYTYLFFECMKESFLKGVHLYYLEVKEKLQCKLT